LLVPADAAVLSGTGKAGGKTKLAVEIPAELEIVGEDEISEGFAITRELVGLLDVVEVLPYVLRFDVAERYGAAHENVVRCPAGDLLRFVDGLDASASERVEEGLQRRAVGVLRCMSRLERAFDGLEVGLESSVDGHGGHRGEGMGSLL